VDLVFDQPMPIFNSGTDSAVWANSCHPPTARVERGSFFQDNRNEFIQLLQFQVHRSFTVSMWAKIMKGDSSLFSFEGQFFNGWDSQDPNHCIVNMETEFLYGLGDLWVSPCNSVVFDFGSQRM
jgi:hypothetical protein